ncbi:MAG: hypothetical protein HYV06_04370 [Deltaproteobacteria bacterium]|nr:hypothetical protein [Deltaproteobacteria bacterium]
MKMKKLIALQVSCEAAAESFMGRNMLAYAAMMNAAEEIKIGRQAVVNEKNKRMAPPPPPHQISMS